MSLNKKEARGLLVILNQILGSHGRARRDGLDLVNNFIIQAHFLEAVVGGLKALDQYLTGSIVNRDDQTDGLLMSELYRGLIQEAEVPLSDGISFLVFRLPTTSGDPGILLKKQNRDDINREVWRKWRATTRK